MAGCKSYVKDTNDILEKLKKLGKAPSNFILVTAEVVQRFSFLKALYEKLGEMEGN